MKNKFRFLLVACIILISSDYVQSIPAFSRKYHTSCVTCHTIFPKLNPFGEAFRSNGYQFPVDDENQVKEEPVKLGSEAYKRVWPKAVWPNSIPGTVPLSLRARTAYTINTVNNSTTSEFERPALQLIGAGTFGRGITLYAGAHLFEDGKVGSIDALFVKFNSVFRSFLPEKLLYIKVGQFIPEMVPFATHHRGLTNVPYAFNTWDPSLGDEFMQGHAHADGPFGIENFQMGIEISGVIARRARYVLGVLNGSGTSLDINAAKDYYGRLSYKIGGMDYNGRIKDTNSADLETSLSLGVFGYKGTATDEWTSNDYGFSKYGGDINLSLKRFNLIGGFIMGTNALEDSLNYKLYFAEAGYMFYPWLTGLVRYESAMPDHGKTIYQFIPNVSALIVANVKVKLESRLNPDDLESWNLFLGIDVAF